MHGPNCIIICIILRIALSCIDLRITFLVCVWFFRVDTDTEQYEQYEQEYDHTPQEDPACTSTADLTGEPFLFAYFTFSLSLLLLSFGCVSFRVTCPIPPVTPYKPCFPTTTYRLWLFVCKPCES